MPSLIVLLIVSFSACDRLRRDVGFYDTEETLFPDSTDRTRFRIDNLAHQIQQFADSTGSFPESISVFSVTLPPQARDGILLDAWGRPIQLTLDSAIYLRSAGGDGLPGTHDDIVQVLQWKSRGIRRGAGLQLSETGIVFTDSMTRAVLPWLGRCDKDETEGITATWTPSKAHIDALEPVLGAHLASALRDIDEPANTKAGEYTRQYFGILRNGERQIHVNGFRRDIITLPAGEGVESGNSPVYPADAWLRNPVVICDAGPAAFRADFNPNTGQLSPIRFSDSFGGRVAPRTAT